MNTGDYNNVVVEINVDRPAGMKINEFLEMVKHQLDLATEVMTQ